MQQIDVGAYRLFYTRTGPGAFVYRIERERWDEIRSRRGESPYAPEVVAAGDVTGLRGKTDVIRAHLTRIGREAVGEHGEPMLRPGHHVAQATSVTVTRRAVQLHATTRDGTPIVLVTPRARHTNRRPATRIPGERRAGSRR